VHPKTVTELVDLEAISSSRLGFHSEMMDCPETKCGKKIFGVAEDGVALDTNCQILLRI
jgi:hypothetical protein